MDIDGALERIAGERAADPLAPITVIAPSHAAALQLRRRLAELREFAAVRFEPMPRVAELLGAARLASEGRSPLARPIGDYLAEDVARESRGALAGVGELAGYGRVLRQIFRRMRRGGITDIRAVPASITGPHLAEILRLYSLFRERSSRFYDEEDLLDAAAAAVRDGDAGAIADLGSVYVVPPGPQTAGGAALIEALSAATACHVLDEPSTGDLRSSCVLAPDPASEAREVMRAAVDALGGGAALHEIAIFYGADPAYRPLLSEAAEAAGLPVAVLPGTPLLETAVGRAVIALCSLPARDYARSAVIDALALAPLPRLLPGLEGSNVYARVTAWDRLSRDAGVTRGTERWFAALSNMIREHEEELARPEDAVSERRKRYLRVELEQSRELRDVIAALAERLDALIEPQPAEQFIAALRRVVDDYIRKGDDDEEATLRQRVLDEVDQLGTVAAVGGTFALGQFRRALQANLSLAFTRERQLGDGVLIAEHRVAAGMRFKHVILCGAREGIFPAGPGEDAIFPDRTWRDLRYAFPHIEDATRRTERAQEAAGRAIGAARGGTITFCAPLYESNGARAYYPSSLMVQAAREHDGHVRTGSDLRGHGAAAWLHRATSPLGIRLAGTPLEMADLQLRSAVMLRRDSRPVPAEHPRHASVASLRARLGSTFSAWDGNVGGVADGSWLSAGALTSPTALETYGRCGFRYFCSNVLRLQAPEEPEEREMMASHARGSLVHDVLQRFFEEQHAVGRPAEYERWTDGDRDRLMEILDDELAAARARGLTGMAVFESHERRSLRADLSEFLEQDSNYREETGAIPWKFEASIPVTDIAGVRLRGFVDRIDRTADGQRAWVIDYKTGSTSEFKEIKDEDPFAGGSKLQLPAYLLATSGIDSAESFYWFITQRGGFEQIPYKPNAAKAQRFENTIAAIASGAQRGVFPAVPGDLNEYFGNFANCRYCDFNRICARRREEMFADKQADPAVSPWLAVGAAARGEA